MSEQKPSIHNIWDSIICCFGLLEIHSFDYKKSTILDIAVSMLLGDVL